MRVAYVGTLVTSDTIHRYSGGSIAGNKYQEGLTSAMERAGVKCDRFVVLPVASFPKGAPIFVSKRTADKPEPRTKYVPYVNLPIAKQVTIGIHLLLMLAAWCLRTRGQPRTLVTFNAMSFMAEPVLMIGRIFGIKRVVVAADIPTPRTVGLLERLEFIYETRAFRRFDALIQITQYIERHFAPGKPCIVIEGGLMKPPDSPESGLERSPKLIVFSGSLDANSGILLLLEAFQRIDDEEARLKILGRGPFSKSVENAQARDSRITYLGYRPNPETVRIQRHAGVLVCPRIPDGFVTMYTFPSKVLEYLATGNRVVAFALEGIPEEYFQYLAIPRGDSADALKQTLLAAMEEPEDLPGRASRLGFAATKSWESQAERLVTFLRLIA